MFGDAYRGKKVLVTGCCGFKGSWLCYWLRKLGANVIGYGHSQRTKPSHYAILAPILTENFRRGIDLLDYDHLAEVINTCRPDLIIHLAAKAIVARTFHEPRETFENNVMGTVNLMEACRQQPSIKGIVCITTDKVYENREWNWGYRENDKLGGTDPYSASKVCIEQVINCYRKEFFPNIATARAGNVIGGGDWSEKRLIPDIARATSNGDVVEVHTPKATRPWQHVLEPLSGYLMLGQKFLEHDQKCLPFNSLSIQNNFAINWNFGPEGEMTVLDILQVAQEVWPAVKYIVKEEDTHPSMVQLLRIDSTEARKVLGWKPMWDMRKAVKRTIMWYRHYYENKIINTDDDINDYMITMSKNGLDT